MKWTSFHNSLFISDVFFVQVNLFQQCMLLLSLLLRVFFSQVLVAHTYNPSYLGG
jgi:hypothetical protein